MTTESAHRATPETSFTTVAAASELRTPHFRVEPLRKMRAEGYAWDHEIRVAVPGSYADRDRSYPVLWVTDNNLEAALSVFRDNPVDLILVAVGGDPVKRRETNTRRAYDFYLTEDFFPRGPRGDILRRRFSDLYGDVSTIGGGAERFLDFLIDDVRPILASEYRMDANDHGLMGLSAGGTFVCYALFARPGAFRGYICGSPALYASDGAVFELEERYAAEHNDLSADVFFAAGEGEMTEPFISAWGCLSSMARMAETLSFRDYPSLRLTAKVFPGETHATMLHPVLSWGVRSVWGDEILSVPVTR